MYIDHVTDSYNESEHENKTIELLDKLDNMYETLRGYSGKGFNPLRRISDAVVEYKDRYVCFRTDFSTTLFATHNTETETVTKPALKLRIKN